jgi:hypothetical protein
LLGLQKKGYRNKNGNNSVVVSVSKLVLVLVLVSKSFKEVILRVCFDLIHPQEHTKSVPLGANGVNNNNHITWENKEMLIFF